MEQELIEAMEKERKYYYDNFYSPKAIFLTVITLGLYVVAKIPQNYRRIGLY